MAAGSADKAFRALKRRVGDGELPVGGKLNESALAREIGVSRTPLREALNRLVGAGLLRARHGDGFQDRGQEESYLRACGVLRRDLVWMSMTTALTDPRRLRGLINRMDAGLPRQEPLRDAQRFLLRLGALSGNGALVRQLDGLNAALAPRDRDTPFTQVDLRRERLVLALAFRQRERAWAALHALLEMPVTAPAPDLQSI